MCTSLAFKQTSIFLSRKADCAQCIVLDFEGIMLALILPTVPSQMEIGGISMEMKNVCFWTTVIMLQFLWFHV